MKWWYVIAREPREANFYIEVFGPFYSEPDARAYMMDLHFDNGWESVEAKMLNNEQATELATNQILWPYK